MKNQIIHSLFALLCATAVAQSAPSSYTSGNSNTVPGHPDQPAELYQGNNPAGGDNTRSNITIPASPNYNNSSNGNYYPPKPATGTPGNTDPSLNNPGNSYPGTPVTPSPTNQVNRLFQDPAKTARYPNADPIVSFDGSSGKYKKNHKTSNGHKFAHHHRHIKKAKKSSSGSNEKSHNENTR